MTPYYTRKYRGLYSIPDSRDTNLHNGITYASL